jgi:hypothetical protein
LKVDPSVALNRAFAKERSHAGFDLALLIELTGRSDASSRVNDGNKAQVKADWAEFIKK